MQSKTENHTMRVFYLLAIVFVVDGHTTLGNLFDLNGLFRYYSFHLMMFAFGSGYFFKFYGGALSDFAHRAKKLLVPLYLWNVVYGVGAALLRRFGGFELGEPISAYTLLLAPLTDGQHFVWNLGAWFIFPLFFAQVFYAGIRRLSVRWHENEVMTFLLCLIPGFAGGQLYRRVLEKRDRLPTVPYLLAIVVLRVLLSTRYENLAYLLSDCSYFVCDAFGVYAGGTLAIAFYLRIARLLAPYIGRSRLALTLSRNTFAIMMHHYMGFFALNCVFLALNASGLGAADFSVRSFRTMSNYMYAPGGKTEWDVIYLLCGLLLPLGIEWACQKLLRVLRRR